MADDATPGAGTSPLRVVVLGATGNVGTSVLRALGEEPAVGSILGVSRRVPSVAMPKVEWASADIAADDLAPLVGGADVVVHLAWLIQPSRDRAALDRVNVSGSKRVFEAAAEAGVRALVYASSVGAYSKGPKDHAVDESWPTDGIPTSVYSAHKAAVERALDDFEAKNPSMRVVRLRPALIFKGEAATEIRRLFAGPFLPNALLDRRLIPAVPDIDDLRFQAVHGDDVGEAYRLAIVKDVRGAFNLAADPVIDSARLASLFGARPVPLPPGALRAAASVSWRARLQPTSPGWLDLAFGVPIMDTRRARTELGWEPSRTSLDALEELVEGMRSGRGFPTPPLDPATSGRFRVHEIRTGVGARGL
jgi:UDP-glucose 4-epimerase